jgi:hypothetical protein
MGIITAYFNRSENIPVISDLFIIYTKGELAIGERERESNLNLKAQPFKYFEQPQRLFQSRKTKLANMAYAISNENVNMQIL